MTLRNFKLNLYKQILYKNSRTKVKQESLSINAIRFYHTHTRYDNVIVYSNFTLSPQTQKRIITPTHGTDVALLRKGRT